MGSGKIGAHIPNREMTMLYAIDGTSRVEEGVARGLSRALEQRRGIGVPARQIRRRPYNILDEGQHLPIMSHVRNRSRSIDRRWRNITRSKFFIRHFGACNR